MCSATVKRIVIAIEWLSSLGAKFMRVVPAHTTAAAVSTLIAQLATLLAFLLPIKVIILLGSDAVPRYFPAFFADMDSKRLIMLLASAALAFYALSITAHRTAEWFVERGATKLLQRSRKIVLFEDQDGLARRAYQRFASSTAALLFLMFGATCLAIIYPLLLTFLLGYISLSGGLLFLGYARSRTVSRWIDRDFNNAVSLIADVGFLSSFALIVLDFLIGSPPSVLIGILSMILARQWTQRTSILSQGAHALAGQRFQLSALFFHGHAFSTHQPTMRNRYWDILETPQRAEWLAPELTGLEGRTMEVLDTAWHQTSIPGVAGIRVQARAQDETSSRNYLVTLFNNSRRHMAQHEATLLAEVHSGLPTLQFIGASAIDGLQVHVFQWEDVASIPPGSLGVQGRLLAASLLGQELPGDLIDRYERSRVLLPKRLTNGLIQRLGIAARDDFDRELLEHTIEHLPLIRKMLASLPMQLTSPGQNADTLAIAPNGQTISTHWGRWNIEPVGAAWPLDATLWQEMYAAMNSAAKDRPSLLTIREPSVRMCSLAFEIDRLAKGEQLSTAIELLPELLAVASELLRYSDQPAAVAKH